MLPDDESAQGRVRAREDQALLEARGASKPPTTVSRNLLSARFLLGYL